MVNRYLSPILLSLFLFFFSFVSLVPLSEKMIFIGDQAWFYLSARDLLLGKSFPLVGITSSHTWLHQGPVWTYLLAVVLWIGRFNPISGGFLSVGINLITILLIYLLGKRMFSKRAALIASFLYAFSPLLVELARMPYHTTPIPLCTLLYIYFLFQWIRGKKIYLSLAVMMLAVLYNFELATVILAIPIIMFAIFGYINKIDWISSLSFRGIARTILMGLIPMIPVIIYDFSHGFKQTIIYGVWLVYHPLHSILSPQSSPGSLSEVMSFIMQRFGDLLFPLNALIAVSFFILCLVFVCYQVLKHSKNWKAEALLLLWVLISICSIIANKTPSDAYLPMLFVAIFYVVGVAIDRLPQRVSLLAIALLIIVALLNVTSFINHNYFVGPEGISLRSREAVVAAMEQEAHGQSFQIKGKGEGSQFRSFTMPYEYLAWYYGYSVKSQATTSFTIQENGNKIFMTKR